MDISRKLIEEFRDKVNDNSYFVLHKYGEQNNINQWNCICSSMDWIEVSIDYILEYKDKVTNRNFDMTVYGYISAIDNILEAINQLHRVLINPKTIPFKGDSKIFFKNKFDYDDDKYFKHIRAVFGAHPVNLKDTQGKWFASYPTSNSLEYDYAVSLWSNKLDINDITFGFKIEDLNKFLYLRYTYLNKLIEIIELEFKNFEKDMQKIKIPEEETPLKKLENLRLASKQRLNNDYYKESIDKLIYIYSTKFSTNKNKTIITEYLEKADKMIEELQYNLQNMVFDDLRYDIFDYNVPKEIRYQISKFFDQVIYFRLNLSGYSPYFFKNIMIEIREYFKNDLILNEEMEIDEIYFLVSALLHLKTKQP